MVPIEGIQIKILVEIIGRINYGPMMNDAKGISEGVRFERQFLFDWTIYPLLMDNLSQLNFTKEKINDKGPMFSKGIFTVEEIGDTFVQLPNGVKGFVVVNGFNIGRFWNKGPQETLYVPGPLLKEGANEIVIFELHPNEKQTVHLIDEHLLG